MSESAIKLECYVCRKKLNGYVMGDTIHVHECMTCMEEAKKPLKLIKEALGLDE